MSELKEIQIDNEGAINQQGKIPVSFRLGLLGRFFRGVENAPTSIAGIVVVLLIVSAIAITFYPTQISAVEFWKTIVLPVVTALFGYLFGKGKK